MRRLRAPLAAALLAALAVAAPAGAAPTQTQQFFTQKLLADKGTSREVRDLLRSRAGFVDRSVKFADLTGDGKSDAVVRVQSGGVTGAVAVYVFSTDTGVKNGGLAVVFRSQELRRAETRIRDGVLRYRSARPAPGDEPCCPAAVAESRLRWRKVKHVFVVAERRQIAPSEPWGDQL
ncbi:MAG: hypothetical protein QOE28_849 [Solirubrobacteraceae bacterium]|jgi:hypothetical protein|nr:hypothetical protein [Solirubrobacteraceae bacterium]